MGWTVILENEQHEEISALPKEFVSEPVSDTSINKAYKVIKYLDPYGDTVFNYLQMDDLISDLEKIQEIRYDENIQELKNLALKCKLERHTYLIFYGD